jgi:hypothetical protein
MAPKRRAAVKSNSLSEKSGGEPNGLDAERRELMARNAAALGALPACWKAFPKAAGATTMVLNYVLHDYKMPIYS